MDITYTLTESQIKDLIRFTLDCCDCVWEPPVSRVYEVWIERALPWTKKEENGEIPID